MNYLYSRAAGVCYLKGVHKEIPDDAIQITNERYVEVFANPDPYKVRGHDSDGLPILLEPPPPSDEQRADLERKWRDNQLSQHEWLLVRHRDQRDLRIAASLTENEVDELLVYRQKLRDWPELQGFPLSAHRPVEPKWLAGLS